MISPAISRLENHPNPFNPETEISFQVAGDGEDIELIIYNIRGQKVKGYSKSNIQYSINNDQYSIVWEGTDENNQSVPTGVYFYQVNTGSSKLTKKMLLLK